MFTTDIAQRGLGRVLIFVDVPPSLIVRRHQCTKQGLAIHIGFQSANKNVIDSESMSLNGLQRK